MAFFVGLDAPSELATITGPDLIDYRQRPGVRMTPSKSHHVTVAHLGRKPPDPLLLERYLKNLSPIAAAVQGCSIFENRRGNVLVWNVTEGVARLTQIRSALEPHSAKKYGRAFAFRPHVTLLQSDPGDRVTYSELVRLCDQWSATRVEWQVDQLHLYHSKNSRLKKLETYTLLER